MHLSNAGDSYFDRCLIEIKKHSLYLDALRIWVCSHVCHSNANIGLLRADSSADGSGDGKGCDDRHNNKCKKRNLILKCYGEYLSSKRMYTDAADAYALSGVC